MKKFRLNLLWAVLLGVALFTGCKKDDDDTPDKPTGPSVAADPTIVEIPSAILNSTDPNLQMVAGYASLANTFSAWTGIFNNIPANATETELKSSGKSWTWSDNQGNSIWIEMVEGSIETTWRYFIKTAEMSAKAKVIEATELKTGLGGSLYIYDYTASVATPVISYLWTKSSTGAIDATLLLDYEGEAIFFAFTTNTDGSGTFKAYVGASASGVQFISLTWNSQGKGSGWVKDPDTGEQLWSSTF